MNRGSRSILDSKRDGRQASMRPRFMNRGSPFCGRSIARRLKASMRPRFMNRGSSLRRMVDGQHPLGFNEAPIHESGKYRGQGTLARV